MREKVSEWKEKQNGQRERERGGGIVEKKQIERLGCEKEKERYKQESNG